MKDLLNALPTWASLLGLLLCMGVGRAAFAQLPSTAVTDPNMVRPLTDTARVAKSLTKQQKREKAAADSVLKTERLFGLHVTRPQKAGWLAAIPGTGQLYNKKYWKLPLVYGMMGGLGYWVSLQLKLYKEYAYAYDQVSAKKLSLHSTELGENARRENSLSGIYDGLTTARHYLDFSILVCTAGYALQILDAVVDAHLHDFDISPNLALHCKPTLLFLPNQGVSAVGAIVALRLK
jgi:hypothetical protein